MQIEKNKVASIDYKLTDANGALLDEGAGDEALWYLHGNENLVSGLENALEGKSAGDAFEITVEPDQAYGPRELELLDTIPREDFEDADELEVGMAFDVPDDDGGAAYFTILEIHDDEVMVDANHPFAGKTLTFDIAVRAVRDATQEELDHGHAHAPYDEPH